MTVLSFVLAASGMLAPARDHQSLAGAIASRVDAEPAFFADDADKKKTAALMVAVAFRESSLRANAVGDHGRSFCAYQVHETAGGTKALLEDVDACVAKGFALLAQSVRVCPKHPLAWYAEGPRGCESTRAQRISADRMALAKRLVREVFAPAHAGFRTPAGATLRCASACPWRRRQEAA